MAKPILAEMMPVVCLVLLVATTACAQNWAIYDLFDGRECVPEKFTRRVALPATGECQDKFKRVCSADGTPMSYYCNDDACNDCQQVIPSPKVRGNFKRAPAASSSWFLFLSGVAISLVLVDFNIPTEELS